VREHEPKVQRIQEQEVMQEREQKQELLIAAKIIFPGSRLRGG
jgi:hypothetical protein